MTRGGLLPGLALSIACAVGLAGCAAFERRPPDRKLSISRLERVVIGGVPQTIRIRGDDRRNPVLLFLHGGPGLPEMPVAHLNADLERDFTVVQWDQRGAGKSFQPGAQRESMRIELFVRDTLELSRLLKREFGGRKIYLAGFSWGSLIAAKAVHREPSLFAAYIGIGQLVHLREAEAALYREALASARQRGLWAAVHALESAGPPPWDEREKSITKRWWPRLRAPAVNRISALRYAALTFTSPVYTVADYPKLIRGTQISHALLIDEIYAADLFREVPRLEVPAFFLMGRHDTVVSSAVLARYVKALQAPRGKQLFWFERSDHAPHLEEPERYREIMRRIRSAP